MKSVIICDMEGVIQEMNQDALKLFGYTKDELIGKKRVSIFSPGEIVIQNVLGWLKKANKEGKSIVQTKFLKKNGSLHKWLNYLHNIYLSKDRVLLK